MTDKKVAIIGVGETGYSMIENIYNQNNSKYNLIAIGTNVKSLVDIVKVKKIQLGSKFIKKFNRGMRPNLAKEAVLDNYNDIKDALDDIDIVVIITGLGGGTGSGATPIVLKIAKEVCGHTICLVSKPFLFEGLVRRRISERALDEIQKECNSVLILEYEKLMHKIKEFWHIDEFWQTINLTFLKHINSALNIFFNDEENLFFNSIHEILYTETGLINLVEASGKNSACRAMKSFLIENSFSNTSLGIFIHFRTNYNYSTVDLDEALQIICDIANDEAEVIFSYSFDDKLPDTYVGLTTIVAVKNLKII